MKERGPGCDNYREGEGGGFRGGGGGWDGMRMRTIGILLETNRVLLTANVTMTKACHEK